jgi:hypothetical protein
MKGDTNITEEGKRKDQSSGLLGEPLTLLEAKLYAAIREGGKAPVHPEVLYERVYAAEASYNPDIIWVMIQRLRDKIGDLEIITHHGEGYTSRRAEIEAEFSEKGIPDIRGEATESGTAFGSEIERFIEPIHRITSR